MVNADIENIILQRRRIMRKSLFLKIANFTRNVKFFYVGLVLRQH